MRTRPLVIAVRYNIWFAYSFYFIPTYNYPCQPVCLRQRRRSQTTLRKRRPRQTTCPPSKDRSQKNGRKEKASTSAPYTLSPLLILQTRLVCRCRMEALWPGVLHEQGNEDGLYSSAYSRVPLRRQTLSLRLDCLYLAVLAVQTPCNHQLLRDPSRLGRNLTQKRWQH